MVRILLVLAMHLSITCLEKCRANIFSSHLEVIAVPYGIGMSKSPEDLLEDSLAYHSFIEDTALLRTMDTYMDTVSCQHVTASVFADIICILWRESGDSDTLSFYGYSTNFRGRGFPVDTFMLKSVGEHLPTNQHQSILDFVGHYKIFRGMTNRGQPCFLKQDLELTDDGVLIASIDFTTKFTRGLTIDEVLTDPTAYRSVVYDTSYLCAILSHVRELRYKSDDPIQAMYIVLVARHGNVQDTIGIGQHNISVNGVESQFKSSFLGLVSTRLPAMQQKSIDDFLHSRKEDN